MLNSKLYIFTIQRSAASKTNKGMVETSLNLADLMRTDVDGKGYVNILPPTSQ